MAQYQHHAINRHKHNSKYSRTFFLYPTGRSTSKTQMVVEQKHIHKTSYGQNASIYMQIDNMLACQEAKRCHLAQKHL